MGSDGDDLQTLLSVLQRGMVKASSAMAGETAIATAPDTVALAASYEGLFAATNGNDLIYLRFDQVATGGWLRIGHANDVRAMTNMNGRLFCVTADRTLWTRATVLYEVDWTVLGAAPADVTGLAGHAGRLIVSTSNDQLWWRD